eukprot:scaffold229460_cov21-Tisochrysis_lutea.AAC.1
MRSLSKLARNLALVWVLQRSLRPPLPGLFCFDFGELAAKHKRDLAKPRHSFQGTLKAPGCLERDQCLYFAPETAST